MTSLSGTKIIGFNTVEAAFTQVVITLLAKSVDISKQYAISSVCMPWCNFSNINNSSSLPQNLHPGSKFLGITRNFLIIQVDEIFVPHHQLCMKEETIS